MTVIPTQLEVLLFAGYILFSVLLNVIAYLISVFYQKKFEQPAPRAGFISAIILALAYMIFLFTGAHGNPTIQKAANIGLILSGAATVLSISTLYRTMRKVRK